MSQPTRGKSRFWKPAVAAGLFLTLTSGPAALAQSIETVAQQMILIDGSTGAVLAEKNADAPMHPSSMSKIMTVMMVFERLKAGTLTMEDSFPVSERAWRMGGSKMFVHVGSQVRVQDLLRGIIVQSGNDACVVVAEGLAGSEERFADEMTRRLRDWGLTQSRFVNATGWPDDAHLTTAREMAQLAQILIERYPDYYSFFSELSFTYNGIKQGNRNPLLYKSLGVDGLKTGHTEAAGYGLTASAVRDGRRLILVVNGLNSVNQRSMESERLLEHGFREFNSVTLFKAGENIAAADVWMGERERVPLVADRDVKVTLPRKARADVKARVLYRGPVPAPVVKGDPLGTLVISTPGMGEQRVALHAGESSEKLTLVNKAVANLSHLIWGRVAAQ